MFYAVRLTDTGNEFIVTCRDLQAFNSVGDTKEDALRETIDGLETTLQMLMDDREPIPPASQPRRGEYRVYLPALAVAKLGLYQVMQAKGLRKADMVRLLGVHPPQVDRLLSLMHQSKIEQVDSALRVLGYHLSVTVEKSA